MNAPPDSLLALVRALIDELEESTLEYALGGALAYSAWAEPRATRDIDVNVWLAPDKLEPLVTILSRLGATTDVDDVARASREQGMFLARCGEYRIDVFIPSVPYYDTALRNRRRVRFLGRECWILAPESLAVFKMLFHRPKDLADLGRLLSIQGERFRTDEVRDALIAMFGEGDDHIAEWDELVKTSLTD